MKYTLIRDVTMKECSWLDEDLKEGLVVYKYYGCTYGCVTGSGIAVTLEEDQLPFFEIPCDAIV